MAPSLPFAPLAIASLLTVHGLRKGSLSISGAIGAFLVGAMMFAVPLRSFAISLIGFYLLGSRATKVGRERKRKLEEGYDVGSRRNAFQVLCNSLSAFCASILWSAAFVKADRDIFSSIAAGLIGILLSRTQEEFLWTSSSWCAVDTDICNGWSRALVFAALGHFSCCLGDTFASELGILSKSSPILITTMRKVPPGTNGGITWLGTIASVTGGVIMGIIMTVSLLVENSACRTKLIPLTVSLVGWGAFAGLLGSIVDSLFGATLQKTRYSEKNAYVLTDNSHHSNDDDVKVISGMGFLSNNQINLISSTLTAVLTGYWATNTA